MTKSKQPGKVSHRIRSSAKRVAKSGVLYGIKAKYNRKPQKKAYRIVGRTTDGVTILRPKVRPKHFTSKQIRSAISQVQKAY
jgi:hypothetical protein